MVLVILLKISWVQELRGKWEIKKWLLINQKLRGNCRHCMEIMAVVIAMGMEKLESGNCQRSIISMICGRDLQAGRRNLIKHSSLTTRICTMHRAQYRTTPKAVVPASTSSTSGTTAQLISRFTNMVNSVPSVLHLGTKTHPKT